MRYQLTAKVQADNVLSAPLDLTDGPVRVHLAGAPGGPVTEIAASKVVHDYAAYLPHIDSSTSPPSVRLAAHPADQELLQLLQYFEALGSFWLGFRRIDWATLARQWIPETPEEDAQIDITGFSQSLEYPLLPRPVIPEVATELLLARHAMRHLVLPMSFYREGVNDYRSHRYINAVFNFYFFLEDLYGDGNTKNHLVLRSFASSHELRDAVAKGRRDIIGDDPAEQLPGLLEFLRQEHCDDDIDGLLKMTVRVRGNLHHFSQRSTKLKGHPLNHGIFRPVAYFLYCVCTNCAVERLLAGARDASEPARGA